jgi:hypothetical protein
MIMFNRFANAKGYESSLFRPLTRLRYGVFIPLYKVSNWKEIPNYILEEAEF